MTVLLIIASVLALLLFLLLAPVSLRFSYREQTLRLKLHYLFLRYDISPDALERRAEKKAKKPVKEKKPPKAKKSAEEKEEAKPSKGFRETARSVWELLRASGGALNLLRHHLILYRIRLHISVAREDAHQTAVASGTVSALVTMLLSILDGLFVLRPEEIQISPDFLSGKTKYDCSLRVRIQPIIVLLAAFKLGIAYVKAMPKRPRKQKTKKGGQVHESATSH